MLPHVFSHFWQSNSLRFSGFCSLRTSWEGEERIQATEERFDLDLAASCCFINNSSSSSASLSRRLRANSRDRRSCSCLSSNVPELTEDWDTVVAAFDRSSPDLLKSSGCMAVPDLFGTTQAARTLLAVTTAPAIDLADSPGGSRVLYEPLETITSALSSI